MMETAACHSQIPASSSVILHSRLVFRSAIPGSDVLVHGRGLLVSASMTNLAGFNVIRIDVHPKKNCQGR